VIEKRLIFAAVQESGSGTNRTTKHVRSHVGNRGLSGRVMLVLSFVDPDPKATCRSGEDHLHGSEQAKIGFCSMRRFRRVQSGHSTGHDELAGFYVAAPMRKHVHEPVEHV